MKVVLEFGVRGGYYVDNIVLPGLKKGVRLATAIANTYGAVNHNARYWDSTKSTGRMLWYNDTHFVVLSMLDGVPRGPATPALWWKKGSELHQVSQPCSELEWYRKLQWLEEGVASALRKFTQISLAEKDTSTSDSEKIREAGELARTFIEVWGDKK